MALTFDDTQSAALLKLLGLPADTTDVATILATVTDALATMDPAKPSQVAAAAKRNGLVVVDNDTLAALRRDAAEGRTIKAAAERKRVDDIVGDAIAKGKIVVARRKHWVSLIEADPGMAEVLASVPDETAVPLTEIGHGVDGENGATPDAGAWFHYASSRHPRGPISGAPGVSPDPRAASEMCVCGALRPVTPPGPYFLDATPSA